MADNNTNNGNAALQAILPNITNPNSGLSDNHAQILQGLIDKAIKGHAQSFLDSVGPDLAQQVVNTHNATSQSNQDNSNNDSSSTNSPSNNANILDPLIAMAQKGQTTLPAQPITTPAPASNVKRGNFEFDKPANLFESLIGRPQVYQDDQGVTHYKPGGLLNSRANQEGLDQAKALQNLSGTEAVQPQNSIAYGVESAIQNANKVPMNQAQKAEYNLQVQQKGLEIAGQLRDQFTTQTTPIVNSLQKIDQLLPLEQAALNGDRTAQASVVAGAKEIYGQAGNILGQGVVGKLGTYLGGKYDTKSVQALLGNLKSVRGQMINKLTAATKNTSSKIGDLKIGDKIISGRDLLSTPYSSETISKGDTESGFKFKGGDPANKNNWEKI